MSFVGKIVPALLGFGFIGSTSLFAVNASSGQEDMVSGSGSVTLDDKDRVLSASSQNLYNKVINTSKLRSYVSPVNFKNSRWVFYSDGHNYLNGYKKGHSNYLHHKIIHGSKANVGKNSSGWVRAGAQKWSYATVGGKGTFKAFFDAAYK